MSGGAVKSVSARGASDRSLSSDKHDYFEQIIIYRPVRLISTVGSANESGLEIRFIRWEFALELWMGSG